MMHFHSQHYFLLQARRFTFSKHIKALLIQYIYLHQSYIYILIQTHTCLFVLIYRVSSYANAAIIFRTNKFMNTYMRNIRLVLRNPSPSWLLCEIQMRLQIATREMNAYFYEDLFLYMLYNTISIMIYENSSRCTCP